MKWHFSKVRPVNSKWRPPESHLVIGGTFRELLCNCAVVTFKVALNNGPIHDNQLQFSCSLAMMKSLLVITLVSLTGSSLGLFQPILTSFLSKQMNAARYHDNMSSQSFLVFFRASTTFLAKSKNPPCVRGYPNKHHVQVVLEVKEDKVDKFLELIPGLFFGSQVASSFRV